MKDLIEALQIFLKYSNEKYPTHCEHDVLYVFVSPEIVSEDDTFQLEKLGFTADGDESFRSYRFGSC